MRCSFTIFLGLFLMILLGLGCATADKSTKAAAGSKGSEAVAESCAGCEALAAGATGWCKECGKGFHEGQEVNCVGGCKMNPGGPPCAGCVK
ncbi:MAG: hypothetical protein ACYTG7_20825 [Planctomycetota bacterium]